MPRKDPTFSSSDLIRMWVHNLNKQEQDEVRCFFLLVELTRKNEDKGFELIVILILKLIPLVGNVFAFIEEIFELIGELTTAAECIKELTRR